MANGYFERGEIYKVRMDYGVGVEEGAFRPGLVISSNRVNNSSGIVLIAYLSRKSMGRIRTDFDVETMATGIQSYVLCNQIAGVDKNRLMGFMGKLGYAEQRAVDDVLEDVIDLGYADEVALKEKDKEIESLKAEIAALTGEVAREQARGIELQAKHDEELLSYKVENAMWQKCYDKALTQLVDMKYTNDLFLRNHLGREPEKKIVDPEEPVIVPKDPPEPPKQPEEQEQPPKVDINSCTATALKKAGFSLPMARKIVAGRPYKTTEDLKNINGMKASLFRILEPKLCCVPVVVEEPKQPEEPVAEVVAETEETEGKLNINAVSAKELHEATGLNLGTSYSVIGYRRKNGPYKELEDLLKVNNVFPGTIDKLRDKVWCGPGSEEAPSQNAPEEKVESDTGFEKLNVNTCSAKEFHDVTGLCMGTCYSLTGYRKKNGPFKKLDDLLNVANVKSATLERIGHLLEV